MSVKILFLCVANSARSQVAEAVAKKVLGDNFEIQSAGSNPSGHINSAAIETLKESGFSTKGLRSKSIDSLSQEFVNKLDFVISLCAEEVCPIFISKAKKLRWTYSDPAKIEDEQQRKRAFSEIIEDLEQKLARFKEEVICKDG